MGACRGGAGGGGWLTRRLAAGIVEPLRMKENLVQLGLGKAVGLAALEGLGVAIEDSCGGLFLHR